MQHRKLSLCAALVGVLCTAGLHAEEAQTPAEHLQTQLQAADYGEQGELILTLWLRKTLLSDGFLALVKEHQVYLPLGALSRALELAIFVEPDQQVASGWFLDPSRNFELRVADGYLQVDGETKPLEKDSIWPQEDDLYVRLDALSEWLPVNLDLHLRSQQLVVRSREELPLEQAQKRAKRQARGISGTHTFAARKPYITPPYRLLDWPVASVRAGSQWHENGNNRSDYSLRFRGDLAFLNGELYAAGDDEALKSARLSLGRRDPKRKILGPLKVAEFELGDTRQSLPSLVGSSLSGRGLRFSNRRLSALRSFNRIDLEGVLPADYEVELYVNNRLMSVFRDQGTGNYLFENVPLQVGQNEIRLEFYGQQGQRDTKIQRTYVGAQALERGDLQYEFALLQPGRQVFEDALEESNNNNEDEIESDTVDAALGLRMGIGSYTSLGVNIASLSRQDDTNQNQTEEREQYTSADLSTEIRGVYATVNATADPEQDLAGSINLGTQRGLYRISASHSHYERDFQRRSGDNNTKQSSQFSLSRDYRAGDSSSHAWGLSLGHSYRFDDNEDLSADFRYDLRWRSFSITSNHSYQHQLQGTAEDQLRGRLNINWRVPYLTAWHFRSEWDYEIEPEGKLQSAALSTGRSFGAFHQLGFRVQHQIGADDKKSTSYSASWRKRFRHVDLDVGAASNDEDEYSLRMGLSFDIGRYPGRTLPRFRAGNQLASPSVGVTAFVDTNNNQRRDAGEEGIGGVQVTRNGLGTRAVTNADGYALLSGLSGNVSEDIGLNPADVSDISLQVQSLAEGVLPRPGRLPILHIPVVRTGEVEGTVTLEKSLGKTPRPAPNVRFLMVSESDGKSYEVFSEFDGLFVFAGIPLGRYRLSADGEQLSRVGLRAHPEQLDITLDGDTDFISDVRFSLRKSQP